MFCQCQWQKRSSGKIHSGSFHELWSFLGGRVSLCWGLYFVGFEENERKEALRSANEEAMGHAMARAKVTMETAIAGAWPKWSNNGRGRMLYHCMRRTWGTRTKTRKTWNTGLSFAWTIIAWVKLKGCRNITRTDWCTDTDSLFQGDEEPTGGDGLRMPGDFWAQLHGWSKSLRPNYLVVGCRLDCVWTFNHFNLSKQWHWIPRVQATRSIH